jgi:GH18 family chitinase
VTAFDRGTTITITVKARNWKNQLVDPTSIKVTVYDPAGAKKVDAKDMTKDTDYETGHYFYNWQSAKNDAVGKYDVEIEAVSDTFTSIMRSTLVTLE